MLPGVCSVLTGVCSVQLHRSLSSLQQDVSALKAQIRQLEPSHGDEKPPGERGPLLLHLFGGLSPRIRGRCTHVSVTSTTRHLDRLGQLGESNTDS